MSAYALQSSTETDQDVLDVVAIPVEQVPPSNDTNAAAARVAGAAGDPNSQIAAPATNRPPSDGVPAVGVPPGEAKAVAVMSPGTDKPPFPLAPTIPSLAGPKESGIRFDFNDGCRVMLPKGAWRVTLRDAFTHNVLFETQVEEGFITSGKKYFVPFEIEIWKNGKAFFKHRYDARERKVLIMFPIGTLGDTMGWMSYAARFQEKHGCALTISMAKHIIPLFEEEYPEIRFVTPEEVRTSDYYASYRIGLFFTDKGNVYQPSDFRHVGLHRTAGYILGVDPEESPPRITLKDNTRPIEERYVCIAAQASTQCKYWNFPGGWKDVVQFLKDSGYRVICIDQKAVHGTGVVWNHIPYGAEDETGDRSLSERARWLKHADFFVGLSSGLAWLAWAVRTPVVMISGFTHENNEFKTPYRVINYHTCNSCWNDPQHQFDHKDFMWCPRHANTNRQFECTKLITPDHVKEVIATVPGFTRKV